MIEYTLYQNSRKFFFDPDIGYMSFLTRKVQKFPSYKESHSIHPKHILALCEGLISPSKDKHKNADDQKISKRMMNI